MIQKNASQSLIAQQQPPPGGYSIERFESYLDEMSKRVEQMQANKDHRAVFEMTYLVFSRQVLSALKAKRFEDMAWATDMACRFIEVYRHQLSLWESRDPSLCRAWRVAFEAMEEGRVNVLQAMLLGINAHINYDLAFVSLGASRYQGDLQDDNSTAVRALSGSRTGVPTVRYRDFLVINQLEWEAISLIQDVVLKDYNKLLYWGNRATMRFTRFMGQRILMEARDISWNQTTLLVHAREGEERQRVARLIDAYAASIADVVQMLTHRPDAIFENVVSWFRRGERIDPELQAGFIDLARRNPVIAELALGELAFGGADPVSVMLRLLSLDEPQLAGTFGRLALKSAPAKRKSRLARYLGNHSAESVRMLEAMVDAKTPIELLPKGAPIDALRTRWRNRLLDDQACLQLSEVQGSELLSSSLQSDARALRAKLHRLGDMGRAKETPHQLTLAEAKDFLANHPERWIRVCSAVALGLTPSLLKNDNGDNMASVIERVLFLKETQVFMEVDISVLVHVAENLQTKTLAAGEKLVKNGERSGALHFIAEGQAEVSQVRNGRNVRIAVLGPRDPVGELSALNDTPATADCTAITPLKCYVLPSEVLSNLLHQHPRLSIGVIRMLSQRLMATTLRVNQEGQAAQPVAVQVAN